MKLVLFIATLLLFTQAVTMKAETDLELQATGKLAIDLAMQKMKDSLNRMVLSQTTHHDDDDDEEEDADDISDSESDDSDDESLLLA